MEPGIEYQEIGLLEFSQKFSDEDKCREHLFKMRWPERFICPRCGCIEYYYHSTRRLYQCKGCKYQASITAGTVFHRTRTPLVKWFWAIFLIARQKSGISSRALMKLLKINSYQTVWSMCHKIRKAMGERDAHYKLAGLVEMDEAYFGGSKPGPRGRGSDGKTIVAVCVEDCGDSPGYATMQVIDEVTSEELAGVAEKKIKKEGTTIKTDGFRSYRYLNKQGFVQEGSKASGKHASIVLPWVHTFIGNVKSTIQGIFHGVSGKHLQRFLDECSYRFNRRFKEAQLFDRLLLACTKTSTITYAELVG
jgi:transposase-like protein